MTILDVVMMLVAVVIIFLVAAQGLIRALIVSMAFYVVTSLVGVVALSYTGVTKALSGLTRVLELGWPQSLTYQGLVFLGLGVPMFGMIWFLVGLVLGDVNLPAIKGVDGILALLVGVVLALVVVSVLCNVWGILVSSPWRAYETWSRMYAAYRGSWSRPYLQQILAIYRQTLFFFQITRMPGFLVPQL